MASTVVRGGQGTDLCVIHGSSSVREDISRRTYMEVCRELLANVYGDLVGGEEEVELSVVRERHYDLKKCCGRRESTVGCSTRWSRE